MTLRRLTLGSCFAALTFTLVSCAPTPLPAPIVKPVASSLPAPMLVPALATLTEGQVIDGFTTQALYVDDHGLARGARFVHQRTGFLLDYLAIETAPQAMFYVSTYPTGDGGEPHTQEHLLLGKGNKGRWLGNVEGASASSSEAFTAQRRTVYGINTAAGPETFWRLYHATLDAMLHPDYGNEEMRREVRNFGVDKLPDGTLSLAEKGTVYNEMVSTFENPGTIAWYAMRRLVFGEGHPLANVSGGSPEGIRGLTLESIRAFHAAHYRASNMGVVGVFPSAFSLETVLARVDGELTSLEPTSEPASAIIKDDTMPPTHPAPLGTIGVVDFPYASTDHPSDALLTWPATHKLEIDERTILEAFLEAFAGAEGSVLYKAVVDQKTRVLDLGATGVWAWVDSEPGQPVYMGVNGLASVHADEASMEKLRATVLAKLRDVAAMSDGSKELAAFDERLRARIVDLQRREQKRLDTPPSFGARSTGDDWVDVLDDLAHVPGFRKSLTYKDALEKALALADPKTNEWRERIRAWGLFEQPYVVTTKPSPAMRARLDHERSARVSAELARLETSFGTKDPQEALRKREAEIAKATEGIAKEEATVPMASLPPDPPMTADDSLKVTTETRGGVLRVASTFDGMKSATVGVSLNLDGVPEDLLPWLGVLPALMSEVGLLREGVAIPYDEVSDRLRREVLGVDTYYSADGTFHRTELAIEAAGNDVEETKRALSWARDFLATPDWRVENLPRIRDVLDERLKRFHETMAGAEEHWVDDAAESLRHQDQPLLLHTSSPLTRVYDALSTSWQVQGGDDARGVAPFLKSLAGAGKKLDRDKLAKLAEALSSLDDKAVVDPKIASWVRAGRALSKGEQSRVRKAGRDLGLLLTDIPNDSLANDWSSLCEEMARGAARSPSDALDALKRTLAAVRHVGNARVWLVSSKEQQSAIAEDIDRLLASLDPSPAPHVTLSKRPRVLERARARGALGDASFVGLENPHTASASIVHSATSLGLDETNADALVDYFAVNVFGGQGTQSFYKRIWGAALAYSGYVHQMPTDERREIYSDRCADVPQLLRFLDVEVRNAPADPRFVDYAVASLFHSRVASSFESRARAYATDLADGVTPERVRAFRQRVLDFRARPGLAEQMHTRFVPAMSGLLPSLSPGHPIPAGALYFAVGPKPRLSDYEIAMQHALGEKTKLLRLTARDFWDVPVR